jgi:NADPH:quinone reductase-like Zn-dependent oxidoreductase
VATTSSNEKFDLLKRLGARHVVNYKDEPDWGLAARKLTPNGEGFDIILEVGGPNTIGESLKAVKPGGDIHLIGFLGGVEQNPQATIWQARQAMCNLKSVVVGSRVQFEEMNRAIEGLQLRPVVDESMFGLEQLRDAYQYLVSELSEKKAPTRHSNEFQMDGKHVGKVVVDID